MSKPNVEETFDFGSSYSNNLPKILKALNISLAVTSYQSARLILLRVDGDDLKTHFKAFPRPMGVYADEERITLGTFTEVIDFKRSNALLGKIQGGELDHARWFTQKVMEKDAVEQEAFLKERAVILEEVKQADSLYLQRAALATGMINIHDIAWGNEGLWVVNSTFSCLATLSPDRSFIARWKPPFITELVPEDRCHLNGMAMRDGRPRYVTTFNKENSRDSWQTADDGTLIDVERNEIIADGFINPHSPRYHEGYVYLCESGRGVVWKINPENGSKSEVIKLQGYPRGMAFFGDLLFVGLSKTRVSNIHKAPLPIIKEYTETFSGIWLINLNDFSTVAHIKFDGDVDQIYDIAVIPNSVMPELLEVENKLVRHLYDFTEQL